MTAFPTTRIDGLSRASCVGRAQKALAGVGGIGDAAAGPRPAKQGGRR
ncbi:MAG: hypothetical protein K8F31_05945 [Roseovarius sp.]|nr:hypothetical protein [Roseovarius sp.]